MKTRLTITLDADLVAEVDRSARRQGPGSSRSAVIEEAVRRWSRTQYEAAIRAYYRGQTPAERSEDDAWTAVSAADLARVARDAPAVRRPRRKGGR